jgi:prepilin-type N-terminal cleavage/methylation domain-containing protein
MKRSSRRSRSIAFTLVELLVVIGIIAILAGIIGVSVGSAIKAAKRAKSTSMAVQLQTSIQSYYTEYSVYPVPAGAATGDTYYSSTDQADWKTLTYGLCGNINPYTGIALTGTPTLNTRGIPFLSLSHSDIDANGIPQNPFYTAGSAFAQYFAVAMDTDYSGVIGDSGSASGVIPNFPQPPSTNWGTAQPVPGGVAVWNSNDQPTTTTAASNERFWSKTY